MNTARDSNNPKSLFAKVLLVITFPLAVFGTGGTVGITPMLFHKGRAGAFYSGLVAGLYLMVALWFFLSLRRGRPAEMPRFNYALAWSFTCALLFSVMTIVFWMLNS